MTIKRTLPPPRRWAGRRATACRSKVRATLRLGGTSLGTKKVGLGRTCRYTAEFRVARSRLQGARSVIVRVRFLGNRHLRATRAKTHQIKLAEV